MNQTTTSPLEQNLDTAYRHFNLDRKHEHALLGFHPEKCAELDKEIAERYWKWQ